MRLYLPADDRLRGFVLVLLLASVVGISALLVWWHVPPVDVDAWRTGPPPRAWATMERQALEAAGSGRLVAHEYRALSEISVELQLAVLVGEDIDFFSHGGIDLRAIREALSEWWAGERLRGASTITQQLAKNLFLSPERSWMRKLREARIARWLEHRLGKRRILELYLNVIAYGEGVLGAEAAARHYFGTSASGLTREQAAGLAAAIPAPHVSNPETATTAWRNRRAAILQRMQQAGWLRRRLLSLGDQGVGEAIDRDAAVHDMV